MAIVNKLHSAVELLRLCNMQHKSIQTVQHLSNQVNQANSQNLEKPEL